MLMTGNACGVGKNEWAAGSEVAVRIVQGNLVVGDEIVNRLKTPAIDVLAGCRCCGIGHNLDQRFVIIAVNWKAVGVKYGVAMAAGPIAGLEIKGASISFESEPASPLPNAAQPAVWRGIENSVED